MLMCGPPGAGKSMLAQRLPGLLPELDDRAALEAAAIARLAGGDEPPFGVPPFRAPHHGATAAALIGGGSPPRPGEISRAHQGVLFLDELPEFERRALQALREPMESGEVVIARAAASLRYPARFQLVAAMNPCPCGWRGHPTRVHRIRWPVMSTASAVPYATASICTCGCLPLTPIAWPARPARLPPPCGSALSPAGSGNGGVRAG